MRSVAKRCQGGRVKSGAWQYPSRDRPPRRCSRSWRRRTRPRDNFVGMGRRAAGEGTARRLANGRWQARRKIGARESAVEISASGATRKQALERLAEKVRDHDRRGQLEDAADWTVAQFLHWWVDEELEARVRDEQLAATTRDSYDQGVRLHLAPRLGKVKLVDFRAGNVRRLMTQLEAAGLSANHRASLHTTLSAAMSCAVRYEYLERANPVSLVPAPKVERARRRKRTADEARKLLEAAEETRLYAYWRLLLSAPLRPGEPLGADWAAFDLDAGVYELRRNLVRRKGVWLWHPTKGRRERDVPLSASAVAALRAHRKSMISERSSVDTGWAGAELVDRGGATVRPWLVFTYPNGSPLHQTWVGRELERLCDSAGIARVTPHGLRHMAVTLLTELGVHPRVIQQMSGHADLSTTDVYTGELDGAMRDAVDRLAEALS